VVVVPVLVVLWYTVDQVAAVLVADAEGTAVVERQAVNYTVVIVRIVAVVGIDLKSPRHVQHYHNNKPQQDLMTWRCAVVEVVHTVDELDHLMLRTDPVLEVHVLLMTVGTPCFEHD